MVWCLTFVSKIVWCLTFASTTIQKPMLRGARHRHRIDRSGEFCIYHFNLIKFSLRKREWRSKHMDNHKTCQSHDFLYFLAISFAYLLLVASGFCFTSPLLFSSSIGLLVKACSVSMFLCLNHLSWKHWYYRPSWPGLVAYRRSHISDVLVLSMECLENSSLWRISANARRIAG